MAKVWVLTSEHNDYDQHGEYFLDVYPHIPSFEDLSKHGLTPEESAWVLIGAGGRRDKKDNVWFYLHERTLS